MASMITSTSLGFFSVNRSSGDCFKSKHTIGQCHGIKAMHIEKPLEELYNIRVERKVSPERLKQLGVSRWSVWKTGKRQLPWEWQVDQLVYIEEGEVRAVPDGSFQYMQFVAGDLIRYPKWFEADLFFNGPHTKSVTVSKHTVMITNPCRCILEGISFIFLVLLLGLFWDTYFGIEVVQNIDRTLYCWATIDKIP